MANNEPITINIEPFVMPFTILVTGVIFTCGLFFGLNNIANAIEDGGLVAGTSTTNTATGAADTTTTTAGTTASVDMDQLKAIFEDDSNITFGDSDAKVLFVEFSDPSCPYCHIAAGKNPELNSSAGASFQLVSDGGTYIAPVEEMRKLVEDGKAAFAQFYLNGHGNGEMAAKAQYCAHEKGKFWEVHDLLMTNEGYDYINNTVKNDKTKAKDFANFLKSAVDADFMEDCLSGDKYDERLAEDQALAASMGASGTPNFFVNTTNYAGAYSYSDMEAAVEAALGN